jgi:replicative DNA helicase
VSITDDVRSGARPPSGPPPDDHGPGESRFDRTPPQDNAAEQCVLGGMLLSKDAIADVLEILKGHDFYRPNHATIYDAILDLYGRGEPADPITVAAAVDDVVDLAQQAVYDVTERRVSEDFAVLADMLQPTLDEIEAVGAQGGVMTGVPTGFTDLDRLLNGLHPGQLIIVAGRPGLGKALALDTPLPTPEGWTTMGEVREGDRLLGADGRPTTVVRAFDVMRGRPCLEVEFSDGAAIVADADHLWKTKTHSARLYGKAPTITTTAQIAATLRCRSADQRPNHSVTNCGPLDLPSADLPLPPYALGVWLSDGHGAGARYTSDDPEIAAYIEADGLIVRIQARRAYAMGRRGSVGRILRTMGVLDNKHIPANYLRASEGQRRALLAGLLDADGTVAPTGNVQFAVASERLTEDVHELVVSLGYRCSVATRVVGGRTAESSTAYTLSFATADEVFRLERKKIAHKERCRTENLTGTGSRYIVDVRPVSSVPVRCVTVDNDDHLYLAGRSMIPTHNSTAAMDFARSASVRNNLASAIFSLEMSKVEIVMRLLAAESRVPLHVLRSGQLSDDDWTKLARRMGEISEAPLFVDDTPNMNLMEIRAKARRLKQRHELKLIVVDYLQLMTSPKRVESRQQEVADLSRGLKLLAKEVDCPVIAVSQLNRGPEQRTDKRPQLSDLRESGCLTADTTLLRADTGAPITFATLLRDGWDGISVWSLDEHRRMVPAPLTNVFPAGVKQAYRLQLASGRQVKASGNHRFLTFNGWVTLDNLAAGDRVAIPRVTPPPIGAGIDWTTNRIGLLAHLIGDGCVLKTQPVHYTSQDEANLRFVEEAATAEFGITPRRVAQGNWHHVYLPAPHHCTHGRGNPLHDWFRELGVYSRRSNEKRVPDAIFKASHDQIAVFLRHLWATDGNVTRQKGKTVAKVYYSSTSRELADGVMVLLARFGIVARLKTVTKASYRPSYHVIVADGPSLRTFCREVGVHGARGETAKGLLADLDGRLSNTNVDTLPTEVWELVKAERSRAGLTERQFQAAIGTNYCGSTLYKSCPSRERLARCAKVLNSDALRAAAADDVFWDRVVVIEPLAEEPVFDATVKGTHNFIANGVVAHNSIEQDADVVILLHRDDYYDKESPRAGEADFIVAKHRNGPTDTVTVAAQLHFSRFVDMAIV